MTQGRAPKETAPRNQPKQGRAERRRQQILDKTAELLDEVGFDDLTTILIAKRLDISVGSLYHYFPNKQAVLWDLACGWLEEVRQALDDMDEALRRDMSLPEFAELSVERMLEVYRRQKGILPLVQSFYAVPELRPLDEEHDTLVISRISRMFKLLGMPGSRAELERVARAYLELVHALSLTIVHQHGQRARRTREDLIRMAECLLTR